MVGYDESIEDSPPRASARIGPVKARVFGLNSNTVAFAERLTHVSQLSRRLAESPQPMNREFSAADLLDPEERAAYERCRFLNRLIRFLYPSDPFQLDMRHWKRELFATALFGLFFFALLGPGGVDRKRGAIAKLQHAASWDQASRDVTVEEQRVLDAAASIGLASGDVRENYDFVARRLLEGYSALGDRVLLASPLYMSLVDRFGS
jgi:hypothetical protein